MIRTRAINTFAVLAVTGLSAGVAASAVSASTDVPPTDPAPAAGAGSIEGAGFAAPEDAVSAYLSALSAGDLTGAISAFSVETYVEHFDFDAFIEWLGFYHLDIGGVPLPTDDPLNAAFGVEQRRADVVSQILNQYFALLMPDVDRILGQVVDSDSDLVDTMSAVMISSSLAGLAEFEFVPLDAVDPDGAELYAGRAAEHRAVREAALGMDESQAIAVETTVNGGAVTLVFEAARYGDAWWIDSLGGSFGNIVGIDSMSAGVLRDDAEGSDESGATDGTEAGAADSTAADSTAADSTAADVTDQ